MRQGLSHGASTCALHVCAAPTAHAPVLQACLDPPLTEPPADDEDWFCPPCVQVQLLKGAIVQVQEPVAGAGGAGSGAGKRRRGQVTTTRTRYLALTDEFVASLPAPPALVSSDEEDGGSDDSGSEAGSMFADSGSEDDNSGTAADDGNTRSRKRARTGAAPGGKADTAADPSLGYFMAHRGQSAATSGATLAGLPMFDAPGVCSSVGWPVYHPPRRPDEWLCNVAVPGTCASAAWGTKEARGGGSSAEAPLSPALSAVGIAASRRIQPIVLRPGVKAHVVAGVCGPRCG